MHITYRRKICVTVFMILLSFSLGLCAVLKTSGMSMAKDSLIFTFKEVSEGQPQRQFQAWIPVQADTQETLVTAHMVNEPMFIIRLVGDELRIIPYGQETEYTVIPSADPRTFRESDRLRLIDGIEIHSTEELAQLIEDFSS